MTRTLVVTADDFGRSASINAGVLRAHVGGIVTSASLMVRWPDAPDAARSAQAHPDLGVGLHLDFGEWSYRDGRWVACYEVVDLGDPAAVDSSARGQLERFRSLVGGDPTHIDSHQHVHREGAAEKTAVRMADDLGVPLRSRTPGIAYCGDFYGRGPRGERYPEGVTAARLVSILEGLAEGVTELSCHPGEGGVDDPLYGPEREAELSALTDVRVRAAVDRCEIELVSFRALRATA